MLQVAVGDFWNYASPTIRLGPAGGSAPMPSIDFVHFSTACAVQLTTKMASDAAKEIASTIQAASINRHPSPRHDLNPSTAASGKQPVRFSHKDHDVDSDVDEDEIPLSVLEPVPRHHTMPPLPDMRFEQSYLKSIEHAEGWKSVLWITIRDQV